MPCYELVEAAELFEKERVSLTQLLCEKFLSLLQSSQFCVVNLHLPLLLACFAQVYVPEEIIGVGVFVDVYLKEKLQ